MNNTRVQHQRSIPFGRPVDPLVYIIKARSSLAGRLVASNTTKSQTAQCAILLTLC